MRKFNFVKSVKFSFFMLLLAFAAAPAHAIELGMTPSHVSSLWMNINNALVDSAAALTGDDVLSGKLSAMTPEAFQGKKPGDVLEQVARFRGRLDRLLDKHGQKATPIYLAPEGGDVTPSVVFVNTGHVLDSTVLLLIQVDRERLISGYFTRHDISGKTPSGAYSLVNLANRRMDSLLRAMAN